MEGRVNDLKGELSLSPQELSKVCSYCEFDLYFAGETSGGFDVCVTGILRVFAIRSASVNPFDLTFPTPQVILGKPSIFRSSQDALRGQLNFYLKDLSMKKNQLRSLVRNFLLDIIFVEVYAGIGD